MFLSSLILAAQLWATFGGIALPQIPSSKTSCIAASVAPADVVAIQPQSVTVDGSSVTVVFNILVPPALASHVSELNLEAPYYIKLDDEQTQYTDAKAYIDPQVSVPVVVRFEGLPGGAHRLRAGYFQVQKNGRKATLIESHFQVCFRTPGSLHIGKFKKSAS